LGFHQTLISTLIFPLGIGTVLAAETPVIPTGSDAYRMWDRWANQRIGVRAYMRSTYDRQGGNERADAAHFLYQLAPDYNVTLDLQGRGILYFVRYNHWHGSPWHYDVDGKAFTVTETSTPDPLHPAPNSVFEPAAAFPKPLTFTWADTKGADLSWVPVGFNQSFRMAYSRTFYGTGYYIYHQFVEGTKLSQPIRSWSTATRPDEDILKLINRAGTDLADKKSVKGLKSESGKLELVGDRSVPVWTKEKSGVVRALEFSIPQDQAKAFSRARLRIVWDGRAQPSVDVPISLFYGAGTLYNRDNREYLVKSFPMVIRYADGRIHFACYLPMPFFKSARIELGGAGTDTIRDIAWNVRYAPLRAHPADLGYLHATYRDFPTPEPGKDLVLLNTTEVEGGGDWSGQFIGTSFIFSHAADLRTLEGDPRFFFDDSLTPQAQGTGTEEWGGGGDYWGGLNMTLPFAGHPVGARNPQVAVSEEDRVESAYRFLLADLMPFGKNAKIQLEHGGVNESTQHYETIAYWYGLPAPSLLKTDELSVGDKESEQQHQYSSPEASAPYEIKSRYEWGPDTLNGQEIYPETVDHGRTTKTGSEFTLRVDPNNLGVMLRRKLDYSFPNQRAEVYISDGQKQSGWQLAGVWYLAGSNTCVFSNPPPKDELGATQHIVETSNRRFRDDEFLVPLKLTKGRSTIRVRLKFTPVTIPLFPGYGAQEIAWSEIRYSAYSFVRPKFPAAQ
jgi:hypothetical protein